MQDTYVIGVDFGTDSVRSVVVDAADGREMGSAVHYFTRWKQGLYCDPIRNQYRQHPLDHLEGLVNSIGGALAQCPAGTAARVRGLSVDATGSTPGAVDERGVPLALLPEFAENPNAMFILWKDHTAIAEAEAINQLAHSWEGEDYTRFSGGIYSSEWFWAKILRTLRTDAAVRTKAFSWVEHCDWVPALLTGQTDPRNIRRSRCAAGHKAMWHASFGGLPSDAFLQRLDPLLAGLRDRLYTDTYTIDTPAGYLSAEWALKLGLPEGIAVGVGAIDAHVGAIGAQIEPYVLGKVMGTSTCDILVAPTEEVGNQLIRGICGQVDGSVLPGLLGMEAGQSAFGDVYLWFEQLLLWPVKTLLQESQLLDATLKEKLLEDLMQRTLPELSRCAAAVPPAQSGVLALDWMNGRRTPDANPLLKGAITGISLGTDAPRIFRALVEATAFGSRRIVDRFTEEGVPIKGVIALGGIARKSSFVMQILADVLNVPIRVVASDQTCALGAAMSAAVCAGIYPTLEEAQRRMGCGFEREYLPIPAQVAQYRQLYEQYKQLGELIESQMMTSVRTAPAGG